MTNRSLYRQIVCVLITLIGLSGVVRAEEFTYLTVTDAEKLEKAFFEEMNKVVTEGFTEEELKAAKTGWLQSRSVSRSQDNELSSRLNSYLYYDRTLAFDADFEKKVEALTAAQVNAAMKKFVDPKKISIVKAGDFDKKPATGTPGSAAGVQTGGKN